MIHAALLSLLTACTTAPETADTAEHTESRDICSTSPIPVSADPPFAVDWSGDDAVDDVGFLDLYVFDLEPEAVRDQLCADTLSSTDVADRQTVIPAISDDTRYTFDAALLAGHPAADLVVWGTDNQTVIAQTVLALDEPDGATVLLLAELLAG
jgi:hypothetical protein